MTREEELIIIRRVVSGDTEAFEALVTAYEKPIYNLSLRMLKEPQDAADAVQEAFIKAYTSLSAFRGDSRFSVWLYRLASNICIDMLRRGNRRQEVSLSMENGGGDEAELEIPDLAPLPEEQAEREELRQTIRDAVARLPEESRQILTLRELGGLSYGEIAETLKLEPGTVKSRLNRARKRLCVLLTESGNISLPQTSKKGKEV